MMIVISPSKKMEFVLPAPAALYTEPEMLADAATLARQLAGFSDNDLAGLMQVSDKIASLNFDRYQQFNPPFNPANALQALLAFKGDVYQGFELARYQAADYAFAQQHLRILSGLYGLLRPMDLIQPYRLEMGTPLSNERGKDLYAFWGESITDALNTALRENGADALVNLASVEYFSAVQPRRLEFPVITPVFKEYRNGRLQMISLLAKKARGLMSNFAILNRISRAEDLKEFREAGYGYEAALSDAATWVFTRKI